MGGGGITKEMNVIILKNSNIIINGLSYKQHLDLCWFSVVRLWPLGNSWPHRVQNLNEITVNTNSFSWPSWSWSSWEMKWSTCSVCNLTIISSCFKRGLMFSIGIVGGKLNFFFIQDLFYYIINYFVYDPMKMISSWLSLKAMWHLGHLFPYLMGRILLRYSNITFSCNMIFVYVDIYSFNWKYVL